MAAKRFKIADEEALAIVKARVRLEGGSTHRRPFERTALRNRLFYLGRQWLIEDRATGQWREARSTSERRVFYKANLIIGNVLRSILTVSNANGELAVVPEKNTRVSEKAAWVSTKLFEHIGRGMKMDLLDELACLTAAIDGTAIWKIHWDPEKGELSRFYHDDPAGTRVLADPDPRTMAEKEANGQYEDLATGDVRGDILSLFQCWWDWKARTAGLEDAEWFAQADLVSRDELKEQYGDVVDTIPSSDGREGPTYWSELLSFMTGQLGGNAQMVYDDTARKEDERILRVEMWERPRPSNGMMGRYLVTGQDVVLENRDNKYRVTKHPIPFIAQHWIACPGRFWGISLLEQLTGPQRQYNQARSKKIQHLNAFGQPMTFLPKEWNVPEHFVTYEPGAIVRYESMKGGEVKYGPSVQLPKEISECAAEARSEIAEISSQQSIDATKMPGQIRSAAGLEIMTEERNKQLLHPAKFFLLAKEEVGRHALELGAKFYPEERIVQYVGADMRWRVKLFKRADIQTDLRVLMVKGELLTSPAMMRARVQEMAALQVLDPMNPDDKEAILRAMEFRTGNHLITDRLQEEENQEREIDEMVADPEGWIAQRGDMMATQDQYTTNEITGEPQPPVVQGYPVNPFDDHQAHSRVLKRFLRSEEYRNLRPEAQQVLLLHFEEHERMIQEAVKAQLEMQMSLQGAPGEPGQPSKPKAKQPSPMSA